MSATWRTFPNELKQMVLLSIDHPTALKAAIQADPDWWTYYRERKRIVKRRVLRNALGGDSVIAASVRAVSMDDELLVRYIVVDDLSVDQVLVDLERFPEKENCWPGRYHFDDCVKRAEVCRFLEILYSRSQKGEDADDFSRLTFEESDRFQAALHRGWFIATLLKDASVGPLCLDLKDRLRIFYSAYSQQEVWDIHHVREWLHDLPAQRVPQKTWRHLSRSQGYCVCTDPEDFFAAVHAPQHWDYLGRCKTDCDLSWRNDVRVLTDDEALSATETESDDEALSIPESEADGESLSAPETAAPMEPIVKFSAGSCWRCSEADVQFTGLPLWSSENWYRAHLNRPLDDLPGCFPGKLCTNNYERALFLYYIGVPDGAFSSYLAKRNRKGFSNLLWKAERAMSVADILHGICDLPKTVVDDRQWEQLKADGFDGLKSSDKLCRRCLYLLIETRLLVWWVHVRTKATKEHLYTEICERGWKCTKQGISAHATLVDHAWAGALRLQHPWA